MRVVGGRGVSRLTPQRGVEWAMRAVSIGKPGYRNRNFVLRFLSVLLLPRVTSVCWDFLSFFASCELSPPPNLFL